MSNTRNHTSEQQTEETYKHGFIKAWKELWEEYDEKKEHLENLKSILSQL